MRRTRKQDVLRAELRLKASYPSSDLGNPKDPLDNLIYIILSGQTNESHYQQSFSAFKRKFPRWKQVLEARTRTIAASISSGGLARQKARYIKGILRQLCQDFGRPTLKPIRRMSIEEAEKYLVRLPGVGIKSARCVLMYTMHRSVFPVDVHCRRIMDRLGWISGDNRRAEDLADEAQQLVPPPLRRTLHVGFVRHGRAVCTPRNPNCDRCCLSDLCSRSGKRRASRPTVVDLCCGAGGFSWGFLQGGFDIRLGVDSWVHALATFRQNIAGAETLLAYVNASTTLGKILDKLGGKCPQIVIAGPPCQGFSRAGSRRVDDPRNFILRATVKLAVDLSPQIIVIENVLNMYSERFAKHLRQATGVLRRAGYCYDSASLRATSFGVPQTRERIVFLASRTLDKRELSEILCRLARRAEIPGLNVSDAFAGLPVHTSQNGIVENHEAMQHGKAVIAKIRRIRPGEGPLSYRKLDPNQPARTLVCGNRAMPCHWLVPRTITVREGARIQGFPDEFRFCGPCGAQMQQVADAVPPRLALGIAMELYDAISPRGRRPPVTPVPELVNRSSYSPSSCVVGPALAGQGQ